jgi:hypothetical protein
MLSGTACCRAGLPHAARHAGLATLLNLAYGSRAVALAGSGAHRIKGRKRRLCAAQTVSGDFVPMHWATVHESCSLGIVQMVMSQPGRHCPVARPGVSMSAALQCCCLPSPRVPCQRGVPRLGAITLHYITSLHHTAQVLAAKPCIAMDGSACSAATLVRLRPMFHTSWLLLSRLLALQELMLQECFRCLYNYTKTICDGSCLTDTCCTTHMYHCPDASPCWLQLQASYWMGR